MADLVVALDARLVQGTNTGDSTYWSGLLYGLNQVEGNVRYLLFANASRPEGLDLDARFEWVHLPSRSSRWWSMVSFPLAARRAGAHVIHTQYTLPFLVGKRGITTVHDVSFLIGPEWFKPKDRILLGQTVPSSVKRAAKVLVVSETGKQEIEKFLPASVGKTVVTPNACPPWIERVDRDEAARVVSRKFGVHQPYLMTVGTRWPRKNMQLAVEAAGMLPERFSERLVVTGKAGWGSQELGKRGQSVGYVDTRLLSCLYSACELYLAPSHHEGFGIPLVEAFRCGCPVLCSTGGALPEVAGDAAFVEASWDQQAWTATIVKLLEDPSKLDSMRQLGLARERLFTWKKTAELTLEVYREVAR